MYTTLRLQVSNLRVAPGAAAGSGYSDRPTRRPPNARHQPRLQGKRRNAMADAGLQRALTRARPQFPQSAPPRWPAAGIRGAARDRQEHQEPRDREPGLLPGNLCRQRGEGRRQRALVRAPPKTPATPCWRSPAGRRKTVDQGQVDGRPRRSGLNEYLEANGVTPVETDLGEYILQLRHEPPSHIIAPAFHLNREDWEETFRKSHTDLPADRVFHERAGHPDRGAGNLREKFLAADMGITGANFLIAETGSSVIVTNEGNGDLTQTLPRVHIVVTSIEKVVPTIEDTLQPAAGAGALGDRAGHVGLHHVLDRPAPCGGSGRAGGIPCRAARQRPLRHGGHRVPGHAALHPLRRLHEPLPGLRHGRRACLRLGLSGADGRGADADADRRGRGRATCPMPARSAANARASAR